MRVLCLDLEPTGIPQQVWCLLGGCLRIICLHPSLLACKRMRDVRSLAFVLTPGGVFCEAVSLSRQKCVKNGDLADVLPGLLPFVSRSRVHKTLVRPLLCGNRPWLVVFVCMQALREDDEVVRAAHSLRSASSPPSTAQIELPFQGADGETVSSLSVCVFVFLSVKKRGCCVLKIQPSERNGVGFIVTLFCKVRVSCSNIYIYIFSFLCLDSRCGTVIPLSCVLVCFRRRLSRRFLPRDSCPCTTSLSTIRASATGAVCREAPGRPCAGQGFGPG